MFGFGKKPLDLAAARSSVMEALRAVPATPFEGNVVDLGFIADLKSDTTSGTGVLVVEVELPTAALTGKKELLARITDAAKAAANADVRLAVTTRVHSAAGMPAGKSDLPGIANVVLVASGKGGVGKSTIASNLAVALAQLGCKVGLLDADIYGPSAPVMFGIADGTRPGTVPGPDASRPMIAPLDRYGVRLMSIGFLVDTSTPMVWRGPMIASAAMQLFKDVNWGALDYLVVDMPPGTGDVQLTISQQVVVAGAVVCSTPQDVALADVIRAKAMFDKVSIPILGVVENMSYFVCDGCNKRHEIFRHGGAKDASTRMNVPFLGEIPLEPAVVQGGDNGTPVVVGHPDSVSAAAFIALAESVGTALAKTAIEIPEALSGPTISITGGSMGKGGVKKGGLPIIS